MKKVLLYGLFLVPFMGLGQDRFSDHTAKFSKTARPYVKTLLDSIVVSYPVMSPTPIFVIDVSGCDTICRGTELELTSKGFIKQVQYNCGKVLVLKHKVFNVETYLDRPHIGCNYNPCKNFKMILLIGGNYSADIPRRYGTR